ncbi:globin-coupled sensor protein [Amaricoccus tamworthensis]|uniref:globin-coupled sensor protein n=1 Tax=Amaricoccus tamworthensis TaxID=57002 RepID=UPI003C79B185
MSTSTNSESDFKQRSGGMEKRLEFMGIDERASASIRTLAPLLGREVPRGLEKFYETLRATPEVSRFFAGDAQIGRAQRAQASHWTNILNGDFGDDYLRNVTKIGEVHAKIGLEPRWYIEGYSLIVEHLIRSAIEEHFAKPAKPAKQGFLRKDTHADTSSPADFAYALANVVKAAFLDMDIAISVYAEEAEKAKRAEAEAKAREQEQVTSCFGAALDAIAHKQLGFRITDDLPPAYHKLRDDFNGALGELASTIDGIDSSVETINAQLATISSSADGLASRSAEQVASLENTAAALEEITQTVRETSQRADEAGSLVSGTKTDAEKSGAVVRDAIEAMEKITTSSNEISKIITVINDIAFQTNLLALNAGVEAARAGEAGRGFAVVAQEVRNLAQRAADASREISSLISSSVEQIQSGVGLVDATGTALSTISGRVLEINEHIGSIVTATREQALTLDAINGSVTEIDRGNQHNANMANDTSEATVSLVEQVRHISALLEEFDTGRNTATAGPEPLRRAS